ncbi:hypothetical protein E3T46_17335 [Cryobacterium sp. Hh11]|uniref:hypothetical protein n=1 Tax=Cryobacterium sp. Hh11 TaxID=2555868 RepID=UPI00106B03A8|nr:hypothetical protein [Cryobacterium sp. Hh11]TFD47559.1 hypothetical protein E3T46_17335 [Cryobacterium sp. Hh11]
MSETMPPQVQFQIQAQWVLDPLSVPAVVNQMLIQEGPPVENGMTPDGTYLTFGHLNPPISMEPQPDPGPDAFANTILPVVPVSRFFVSRERLKSFHATLGRYLEATDPSTR